MLENVQALQKMQNEGFFSAVNEVIYGDNNKALEMYREFGDDKAQDVKSLTTFDIQEDVPNSKVKEKRKGVLVTYDDGTTRKIDPKKLIIDAISATKFIDYGQATQKELREGEDKDLDRISQDSYRQELAAGRKQVADDKLEQAAKVLLQKDFGNLLSLETKKFLDPRDTSYIGDEERRKAKEKEIEDSLIPAQSLGMLNIGLGNTRINSSVLRQSVQANSSPDYYKNPNNFATDKKGNYITKEYAGREFILNNLNVYVPLERRK